MVLSITAQKDNQMGLRASSACPCLQAALLCRKAPLQRAREERDGDRRQAGRQATEGEAAGGKAGVGAEVRAAGTQTPASPLGRAWGSRGRNRAWNKAGPQLCREADIPGWDRTPRGVAWLPLTTGGKLEVVVVDIFMKDCLKPLPPVCVENDDIACPQAY